MSSVLPKMIVENLPSYTSERYYLLSEIEQKVIYVFNSEFDVTDFFPPTMFGVVYCLYNSNTTFDLFKEEATRLIAQSEKFISNFEDALLSIEVLLSPGTDFSSFQPRLQEMLTWLNSTFQFGCVVLGVSDSVAGTVALAKCHEFIEYLYDKEADKMHSAVSFVAADRKQLLGHDPKRDPDAKAGVFQALCYDMSAQKYSIAEWYQNCKDHMVVSGFINEETDKSEEGQQRRTKKNKRNNDPELVWLLFFALVAMLVGVAVKVYNSDSHYHRL